MSLPRSPPIQIFKRDNRFFGVWRSPVARFVRDEEVVGSNPATPTIVYFRRFRAPPRFQHASGRGSATSLARDGSPQRIQYPWVLFFTIAQFFPRWEKILLLSQFSTHRGENLLLPEFTTRRVADLRNALLINQIELREVAPVRHRKPLGIASCARPLSRKPFPALPLL